MAYSLILRTTHGYASHWKHLDASREIGTYTKLAWREAYAEDPEDQCEPMAHVARVRVKAERGVTLAEIKRALEDEFTQVGCDHDHDCCGCRSYRVHHVRKLMDGTFVVSYGSSRNF